MTETTVKNELEAVVIESGLQNTSADKIKESFLPFFDQAKDWREKSLALVVTSEDQTDKMKAAREARLALKQIRVNADKTRKALKEDSLRYGKAVQGVYNVIEYLIKPTEEHLEKQEKYAQIKEAERKAALHEERAAELELYSDFIPYGLDFGNMPDEDYQKLKEGAILQYNQREAAQRKAEEERIAREKAEAEERERIRKENERLKAEREEMERQLKAQREEAARKQKEAEEKAKAIQAEKDRIEAEARAKEAAARRKEEEEARLKLEAELKAEKEREAAEEAKRQALLAPDKEKIKAFAQSFKGFDLPEVASDEAKTLLLAFSDDLHDLLNRLEKAANKI